MFSPIASLHIARIEAAAATLPDGSPILLGGTDDQGTEGGNYEPHGEIYNFASGTFRVTGGLNSLRVAFASALLHDGRLLMAGGNNAVANVSSAELFDPATGYFTPTANNMVTPRVSANAVTREDGKVLVANGSDGETADLFDPATMSFTATIGAMVASRAAATATSLRDGTVLITGGLDLSGNVLDTAEIYDPTTQTFSATSGTMTTSRAIHTATLLSDGRVLIAGGSSGDTSSAALNTAEIYDPSTPKFTATGNTMSAARVNATARLLQDGDVLIAGGINTSGASTASADLFDPATGQFTVVPGTMSNARSAGAAVSLPDGRAMIAGGSIVIIVAGLPSVTPTNMVDFFDPKSGQFTPRVTMLAPRDLFIATLLKSGKVLIPAGRAIVVTGVGTAILETAEVYTP